MDASQLDRSRAVVVGLTGRPGRALRRRTEWTPRSSTGARGWWFGLQAVPVERFGVVLNGRLAARPEPSGGGSAYRPSRSSASASYCMDASQLDRSLRVVVRLTARPGRALRRR